MATRQDVEKAIEAIENGGNNTAKEVRDVLTLLLNYTENEEHESELKPFAFQSTKTIQNDKNFLKYSFRGFEGHIVNLTFELDLSVPTKGNIYSFKFQNEHKAKLIKILNIIISKEQDLSFVVPLSYTTVANNNNQQRQVQMPLNMTLQFVDSDKENIVFDFLGYLTAEEVEFQQAQCKTSICLHFPNNRS